MMRRAVPWPRYARIAIAAALPPVVTTMEKIAALRVERSELRAKPPHPGITERIAVIDAAIARLISTPKENA